ncbi:hypothetical protein L195_g062172, partial [Trifolium pratense]
MRLNKTELLAKKLQFLSLTEPCPPLKEAVTLFGDKVLAGELYATATKLKHQ